MTDPDDASTISTDVVYVRRATNRRPPGSCLRRAVSRHALLVVVRGRPDDGCSLSCYRRVRSRPAAGCLHPRIRRPVQRCHEQDLLRCGHRGPGHIRAARHRCSGIRHDECLRRRDVTTICHTTSGHENGAVGKSCRRVCCSGRHVLDCYVLLWSNRRRWRDGAVPSRRATDKQREHNQ